MAPLFPFPPIAPWACRPEESRGRQVMEPESATRSVFQRDRDRIIHSAAFRKLKYKTQVFVYHEGDYYRTRLSHSLEVAQIARSISRALGLNEDLAEALALAHDLGHTPFGHAGERALDAAMAPYGGFSHNDQALRIVTRLERRYIAFDGLNLTWETLEGLVKHNGPLLDTAANALHAPPLPVTLAAFNPLWDLELASWPSAEAQVAALADDIAYNNHDLDDGLRAGFFSLDDLRPLPLVGPILQELTTAHPGLERARLIHETIRRLIDAMVTDLLAQTRIRLAALAPQRVADIRAAPQAVVAFSEKMREHDQVLRAFLKQRMYRHYRVNRMMSTCRRLVDDLFALFMAEPECLPTDWQAMLATAEAAEGRRGRARLVADYIAGMTDRYALAEHRRLFDMEAQT
mgnify:CR=1 FL=1